MTHQIKEKVTRCPRALHRSRRGTSSLRTECPAASAIEGGGREQPLNLPAIADVLRLHRVTLGITCWAARRTPTRREFYAAGRGITGLQNGLALAGDYMSAARFLGIAGLVALSRLRRPHLLDRLARRLAGRHCSSIAEPLRNLGKYTFADVVAYRLRQAPVRIAAAIGTLTVVAFYLIAQMVGAGNLIKLLFGLPYETAVVIVGVVMLVVRRSSAG